MSELMEQKKTGSEDLCLDGLFVYKIGMSSVYTETGEVVPVTVLRLENSFVSQVKTKERDGYEAIQIAVRPKRAKNSSRSERGHLKSTPMENGAYDVSEIRQTLPQGVQVGQKISINSLAKGDIVSVTSRSKGKGFAGSVKRYGFAGGPASHGSHFHRQPGSSGNRTWPGRVQPGKRWPGHHGFAVVTVKNLKVMDVIPEENVVIVKGSVPGSANTLVTVFKAKK